MLATFDGAATATGLSPFLTASFTTPFIATPAAAAQTGTLAGSGGALGPVYSLGADASNTTLSNTRIFMAFTFTATGLGSGASIAIDSAAFTYATNSFGQGPQTALYIDTGSGFGSAVYTSPAGAANSADGTHTSLGSIPVPGTYTLTNGQSIVFGFTFSDLSSGSSGHQHTIDNLIINGSVVPEPSSALLVGLAGIAALTRRKRTA